MPSQPQSMPLCPTACRVHTTTTMLMMMPRPVPVPVMPIMIPKPTSMRLQSFNEQSTQGSSVGSSDESDPVQAIIVPAVRSSSSTKNDQGLDLTQQSSSFTSSSNSLLPHHPDRPFACHHCPSAFSGKGTLNRHSKVHFCRKPFQCIWPGCGKSFTQLEPLKRHNRVHTGEKPFCCNWPGCEKMFSQSTHRTVHMRSHTGERPYSCSICFRSFAHKSHVKRHAKVHRNTREPASLQCSLCNEQIESAALFSSHIQDCHLSKSTAGSTMSESDD